MDSGIYKLTSPSGKIYVGQSWDIKKRWMSYASGGSKGQRLLHRALLKYPWSEWKKEVLMYTDRQGLLDTYEIHYIRANQSTDPDKGYNIREGGMGSRIASETKQKMSVAKTGKRRQNFSNEHKNRIRSALVGRKYAPERLADKMSKSPMINKYDLAGNLIATKPLWQFRLEDGNIGSSLYGKYPNYKGYIYKKVS